MAVEKYTLRFFFDAGSGVCLWSGNEITRERFGYSVILNSLPLSEETLLQGREIIETYNSSIDWDCPSNPTPWSEAACCTFNQQVNKFVNDLQHQLGAAFIILSEFQPLAKGGA